MGNENERRAGTPGTPPVTPGALPAPREPDWWRPDADDPFDGGAVPGFVGGVEIPELLKPPPPDEEDGEDGEGGEGGDASADGSGGDTAPDGPEPRRRRLRLGSPLLLVSAVLLLAGAAGGWLLPLAAGWLLAYASRERRAAALTLPGLAVTAGAVWLWGRVEGRWGERVATGGEALGTALSETWPWTLRGAAIASGLYLLWRSRRVTG
ncbi:hypothetical protein ACFW6S_14730 [Streptomyces sp. NPDC058740]|uniref:hypothetical protein n=1 Tax=Streptomyces sp. NPDC058740 TaxID=3346619 RepID=UPI0036B9D0D8